MISLNKWHSFPRSLRQLVVMAFLLVLLPLLILAYQAYQSLDQLSNQAADINRTTLLDARRSEIMTSTALEMERSYRQYCVLNDQTFAALYKKKRQEYSEMLARQMTILPDKNQIATIQTLLEDLSDLKCENNSPIPAMATALERFSVTNNQLVQLTRDVVFGRGTQLQNAIAEKGQYFGWQTLIVFLLSVLLVVLFTRMIIGPVKAIERMINHLGAGGTLFTRLERFKGPSELRSLAQRIVWLSERLSWLESQRHEFLRHISHELKTPLASMREGAELLADEVAGPLTLDQREVVAILDNSSKHLQQLIEQLLGYNRQLADGPAQIQQIDLTKLVANIVSSHNLTARAKNIQTEIELNITHCCAEPTFLARVIDNLYSNAVHYGSESGKIWIISNETDDKLQIDIANTGAPIPESEQNMIYEPFFQGSLLRKGAVKGSGLGLSIAQDCIKRMNGQLLLIDCQFADVCFRIELPLTTEYE
ncbi:two-component sensor histidine kinase [Arsenophonus sp. ENCA]|uniref:sensor histidine kinase n=1 Tax=Arsenophonus sp. ENCA TaxID=1987579 RepID=UPI000BC7409D|nr:HAMP domain-containing sensor histidine kinase [Arsenophonus sp. ENCA]PAV01630.1 two-component sensor histidine kinase [Arsenophonus sp. ENCA]